MLREMTWPPQSPELNPVLLKYWGSVWGKEGRDTKVYFHWICVHCITPNFHWIFPLDTGPLRCGSNPVLLCHPAIPTCCGLSPLRCLLPISPGYGSAALLLQAGFAPPPGNPHRLQFESATAQYGRQLASRGRGVHAIITYSLTTAVIGQCY